MVKLIVKKVWQKPAVKTELPIQDTLGKGGMNNDNGVFDNS